IGGPLVKEAEGRPRRLLRACPERPRSRRVAECDQQFPPSDGDCHTPLPCEVRRGNDTTPRACSLHVREGGDAAAFRFGPSMTADVPAELAPKLRDCEIDLKAAFAQVRPAVQRREDITEAMRVHKRVLRPNRHGLL